MKRKLSLCLILFLSLPLLLFAETVILSGIQTKGGHFFSSKLESDPINLPRTGKIIKIEGQHKGFWINKKKDYRVERTYRYSKSSEAKNKTLKPGTYTVYPNLPKGASEARVKVYVELEGGQNTSAAEGPLSPGTMAISGSQVAGSSPTRSAKLKSEPVDLPSAGEIIKVKGGPKGFWINEVGFFEEDRIYRCWDPKKAIGIRLKKGKYRIYPNIPDGETRADVTIYVKVSGAVPEEQSSDPGSPTFYHNYCRAYVPIQSKMYKDMSEETYEAMKASGGLFSSVDDCIVKSLKTEQQYYSMCLDEGKSKSECSNLLEELKEMYRQMSTREGCTKFYGAFCGFYNFGSMEDMPAEHKAKNDKVYQECMVNVDDSCRALPESVSW